MTDTLSQFGNIFQSKVIANLIQNESFLAQSIDVLNPDMISSHIVSNCFLFNLR